MYTCDDKEKQEIKILKKLMRTEKNVRMKLRYHVILLYLRGYHKNKIASICEISYDTVNNYVNSYKNNGLDGLVMGKSKGAIPKLTPEQEQKLYECITTKTPSEVGYSPFMNWTAGLAAQWVKATFEKQYSERGMRQVLYRLGLSYTRPTYIQKKADPIKQAEFLVDFEGLKKTNHG